MAFWSYTAHGSGLVMSRSGGTERRITFLRGLDVNPDTKGGDVSGYRRRRLWRQLVSFRSCLARHRRKFVLHLVRPHILPAGGSQRATDSYCFNGVEGIVFRARYHHQQHQQRLRGERSLFDMIISNLPFHAPSSESCTSPLMAQRCLLQRRCVIFQAADTSCTRKNSSALHLDVLDETVFRKYR